MKNIVKFMLVALVATVVISFASNASARSRFSTKEYRSIAVTFSPSAEGTFFGVFTPIIPASGIIYAPVYQSYLGKFFDGHDHHDTTDGDDTTGDDDHDGDDDGDHDGDDTTDVDDDDHDGDHDGDTTDVGDDTTDGDHGDGDHDGDTTDVGDDHGDDDHHDGNHDENDTIDCDDRDNDHHGDHDNDTTVTHDTTATHDTTDRAMFGSGSQSIIIKTSGKNALVVLEFVNNQAVSVIVSKIELAAGTNFAIVSGAPNHASTLVPGQRITLLVRYTPNGASGQTDQLLITSNSTVPVNPITFKGIQSQTSSVKNALPEGVSLAMAPNPMSVNLTVSLAGIAKSTVTVFDINGKTIRTADVTASSWIWDGTASDGTSMRSGTYFVNVAGTSAEGTPFAATRKIVLNK